MRTVSRAGVLDGDPLQEVGAAPADDDGAALLVQRDRERQPDTARRAEG
nr:hypothetical protein [Cellulosimicrobium sp. MM]